MASDGELLGNAVGAEHVASISSDFQLFAATIFSDYFFGLTHLSFRLRPSSLIS
jgi:hypothetical protein